VDDFDRATARVAARLDDQEARTDEGIEDALNVASIAELVDIGELDDRACAVGRDESSADLLRQLSLRLVHLRDDVVGVCGEGTGDTADGVVTLDREESALAVACVPEFRSCELQEGQGPWGVGQPGQPVPDRPRGSGRVAAKYRAGHQDVPGAVSSGLGKGQDSLGGRS